MLSICAMNRIHAFRVELMHPIGFSPFGFNLGEFIKLVVLDKCFMDSGMYYL